MKKAKVMLMAIAIFGVAGATLAFKANSFQQHTFYYNKGTSCENSIALLSTFTTSLAPGRIALPTYSTASNTNAACVGIYVTNGD